MGRSRYIKDTDGIEAKVDATLEALKVDVVTADTGILNTIEATLTNLEKATATVDTDKLIVQREDAADNVAPSMDVAARKGFVAVTDGTNTLDIVSYGTASVSTRKGVVVLGTQRLGDFCRPLPVAYYTDPNVNKGNFVIPVTPMTGDLKEGTFVHSNDISFSINFGVDNINAKTGFVLIDLSDATNYPHTNTGEIHVDWVSITIHGDSTSTGDIHVGFISAIDADKATMHSIASLQISKLESITSIHRLFAPSAIRCKLGAHLAGGTALHTDDTTFQNDTALTGTFGTPNPAVGDLVLLIDRTAGTFEHVHIAVGYHTEP